MKTKTGPYPTPYIDVYINVLCTYKTIPEKRSSSVCLSPFNHSKEKSFQNNLGPKTMNKEQALKKPQGCVIYNSEYGCFQIVLKSITI